MTSENIRNMTDILASLAEAAGVEALVPEENGRVNFALDDMGVAMGTSDADETKSDGAFSVEHEIGAVVLHRVFPLPMAAEAFVEEFRRLAGAARAARERLSAVHIEDPLALNFIAV